MDVCRILSHEIKTYLKISLPKTKEETIQKIIIIARHIFETIAYAAFAYFAPLPFIVVFFIWDISVAFYLLATMDTARKENSSLSSYLAKTEICNNEEMLYIDYSQLKMADLEKIVKIQKRIQLRQQVAFSCLKLFPMQGLAMKNFSLGCLGFVEGAVMAFTDFASGLGTYMIRSVVKELHLEKFSPSFFSYLKQLEKEITLFLKEKIEKKELDEEEVTTWTNDYVINHKHLVSITLKQFDEDILIPKSGNYGKELTQLKKEWQKFSVKQKEKIRQFFLPENELVFTNEEEKEKDFSNHLQGVMSRLNDLWPQRVKTEFDQKICNYIQNKTYVFPSSDWEKYKKKITKGFIKPSYINRIEQFFKDLSLLFYTTSFKQKAVVNFHASRQQVQQLQQLVTVLPGEIVEV